MTYVRDVGAVAVVAVAFALCGWLLSHCSVDVTPPPTTTTTTDYRDAPEGTRTP